VERAKGGIKQVAAFVERHIEQACDTDCANARRELGTLGQRQRTGMTSRHDDAGDPGRTTQRGGLLMTGTDLASMLPAMLPRLWAFALRLTHNQYDAEELVQQTCVRALERAHQLAPDTSPLSWMFSIIQSIWFNELRARAVRSRLSFAADDDFWDKVPDVATNTPEEEVMYARIVKAIHQLPESQCVVMLLVAVEGFSYNEAAATLGVPTGTVMSRLSRARRAIGALIYGRVT
jgi:RNA polymerase sigma-70 factor, ECF subfamily